MKRCRKCGMAKSLDGFYHHPHGFDGRMNICKECHRAGVRVNRAKRIDYYREYDRQRNSLPHRIEAHRAFRQTAAYKASHQRSMQRYLASNPHKVTAWNEVKKARAKGSLKRKPCVFCGSDQAQAHHHDYSKPLLVMWMCRACHSSCHKVQRARERKSTP